MAHGGNEVVTKTLTTSHESFIAMSPFLSQKKKKSHFFVQIYFERKKLVKLPYVSLAFEILWLINHIHFWATNSSGHLVGYLLTHT